MPKGDRLKLKADPEDGTTPIANLLLEAVAMAKLSGLQKGAILYLWRKTYGWVDGDGHRKKDCLIGLTEWQRALDTAKSNASETLSQLVEKHIITRETKGGWAGYKYKLNTNINMWNSGCINIEKLSKSEQLVKTEQSNTPNSPMETNRTVSQNRTEQLVKTEHTTLLKENINKDKESDVVEISPIIPEWVDKNTWLAFMEMRKKLKSPPTNHAIKLLIKELVKLKELGNDPNEVINKSIMSNWRGFFPLNKEKTVVVAQNSKYGDGWR